jgi:hypothetical protein
LPPTDWDGTNVIHAVRPINARGRQLVYAVSRRALDSTGVSRQSLEQARYVGSGNHQVPVHLEGEQTKRWLCRNSTHFA